MKLSRESTRNVLTKRKNKKPLIHCISQLINMGDLEDAIASYKGRMIAAHCVEEVFEITLGSDGLLLSLATLDNSKLIAMEKSLRAARKKNISILLEISGLNLSAYRRDTALSLLNRYCIDAIIGSNEEIKALINSQKRNNNSNNLDKGFSKECRDFSRINKVVLIVEDNDYYYVTDGFSEFYVKNRTAIFSKVSTIQTILSGMISVAVAVGDTREEKIQGIVTAVVSLCISEELVEEKINNGVDPVFMKNYLYDEISKIDEDKIDEKCKILYEFKR